MCSLLNEKYPLPSFYALQSLGLSKCDKKRLYSLSFGEPGYCGTFVPIFFSSAYFCIVLWTITLVPPPAFDSTSALSILILT